MDWRIGDELDQLVTRGQGAMYNFFNWSRGGHSRLIVLAVANTMDPPKRISSDKAIRLAHTQLAMQKLS